MSGVIDLLLVLIGSAVPIWIKSRKPPIDHKNVNAEWEGSLTAGLEGEDQKPPSNTGPKVGDDTVSAGNPS